VSNSHLAFSSLHLALTFALKHAATVFGTGFRQPPAADGAGFADKIAS